MNKKKPTCPPDEFLLKSYFLAPNAENRETLSKSIHQALENWFDWRKLAHEDDGPFFDINELQSRDYELATSKLRSEVLKLSKKLNAEIPRHSPRYIGHMYSEYTLPSFFGHLLALMYNPNNISTESSRVGLRIEKMAIDKLSKMIGYPRASVGHFTSGGTIANFEMLYRAKVLSSRGRNTHRPLVLLAPESAHYSWEKGVQLIGDTNSVLKRVPLDRNGCMSVESLKKELDELLWKNKFNVWGVVSILGSTELGTIDPILKISKLITEISSKSKTRIWHHVDAAYGGFFAALLRGNTPARLPMQTLQDLKALSLADSITLDPHKLGYTPYSSGCFICRSSRDYRCISVEAPYLDYKKSNDPGPYTIEGSRTAAGPFAIYLTSNTMGLNSDGLGKILERSIESARQLRARIRSSKRFAVLDVDGFNIVCFADRGQSKSLTKTNERTKALYEKMKAAAAGSKKPYYVSKTVLGDGYTDLIREFCSKKSLKADSKNLFLIRCTLMNPFFRTRHSKTNFSENFVEWANSL